MPTESKNCPVTIPVPYTVTVNTSGSTPSQALSESLAATHTGYTGISEFTFTPLLTSSGTSINDYFPTGVSVQTAVWDFGDGYTLSGDNTFIATHKYNVPGTYTINAFFYDKDGEVYNTTFTQVVSVFNYVNSHLKIRTENQTLSSIVINASEKGGSTFYLDMSASWQDTPNVNDPHTLYFTSSGSQTKPYDVTNKYAHLIPFNAFYQRNERGQLDRIDRTGITHKLYPHYFVINEKHELIEISENNLNIIPENYGYVQHEPFLLYSSTQSGPSTSRLSVTNGVTAVRPTSAEIVNQKITTPVEFYYYDDIPTDNVKLLIKADYSKHRVKSFYVDNIDTDINNSGLDFLETNVAGTTVSYGASGRTIIGVNTRVVENIPRRISFTSTGMKEMSASNNKRQKNKFQIFVALADNKLNILKNYPTFKKITSLTDSSDFATEDDFSWSARWEGPDGSSTTSNISSLSTNKFPYDSTANSTSLSSFLYLNIDPENSGTYTLVVSARVPSLSSVPTFTSESGGVSGYGTPRIDWDESGPEGSTTILNMTGGYPGDGTPDGGEDLSIISSSFTFTIAPSTNDSEIYKVNEGIDYADVIKSYRFQSFMHDYDKLFDGVFTSFVGEASSSPTTFGKTIFERTANFVSNNNDIDYCNVNNIQSFYDFLNEDIDFITPNPPPGLKRLYDLFSIKVSKLIGDYTRFDESYDTNFYTSSADSRNIDFSSPIDTLTYTVTADTKFVAKQKFNDEYITIKPQKIASLYFQPANELWDLTTTNLDFSTTTGWSATVSDQINGTGNTPLSGWVLTGNVAGHNPYTGEQSTNNLFQTINAKPDSSYKVTVTVANCTAGTLNVIIGQQSNGVALPQTNSVTDNGTHSVTITNAGIYKTLTFEVSQDFNGSIDNIVIQEVISNQYPLSAYNIYSNWGWPLDTSVSGSAGLNDIYEFYEYKNYDTTLSAENIQNNIIDYNNSYNTVSRNISSLSGSWQNTGGVVYKNLDYQIRKGLKL